MQYGAHWLVDDLVQYDVTQQTITEKYEFNDKVGMATGIEVSVDFALDENKLPFLHTKITDWKIKLENTIKAAAKEVIPQYSAMQLNQNCRDSAEDKIGKILGEQLPQFYLSYVPGHVRLTDVDLPPAISDIALSNAAQDGKNKLALKKQEEAENNFHAAEWTAKTNDILSQPSMLKLKELEIDMEYAKHGVSKYGTNNVFGASTGILLNRN
mgnify:CR=1 FL=1